MKKYITKQEFEEFKKDIEKMLLDIRDACLNKVINDKYEYQEIDAKSIGVIFGHELYQYCSRYCLENMPNSNTREIFENIVAKCYEMFNEIGFVSYSIVGNKLILSVLNFRALLEDYIEYFKSLQEIIKRKYNMILCSSYFEECNKEENIHLIMKKTIEERLLNLSRLVKK